MVLILSGYERTDTAPGSISVTYEFSDDSTRTFEVDGSLFGGADRQFLLAYYGLDYAELDTDFISEVIEEIDNVATWKQIEKLASALCELNEDGVGEMVKDDILKIIGDDDS